MPASELVDLSLNQTLRRTLLTSFATALCVASQLFFGGESLRNLSLALLIGIVGYVFFNLRSKSCYVVFPWSKNYLIFSDDHHKKSYYAFSAEHTI